jgi:hypothetical protein
MYEKPKGITSKNDKALVGVCLQYDKEVINYPYFKIPSSRIAQGKRRIWTSDNYENIMEPLDRVRYGA